MINFGGEINTITCIFITYLDLVIEKTHINTINIDDSAQIICSSGITDFSVLNKLGRIRFLKQTFFD